MLIFTRVGKTRKLGEVQVLFAGKLPRRRKKEEEEEEVGKLVSFQEYTRVWIEL